MKTAIEWLESQLKKQAMISVYNFEDQLFYTKLIKEAKAREKEQIREAYYKGVRDEWEGAGKDFEDYYNEKYANDTTTGLPEENSKRRGWHY